MGTIAQQMNVLNAGFGGKDDGADTDFGFQLADVDYTENHAWFDAGPGSADEAAMKQALKEGGLPTCTSAAHRAMPTSVQGPFSGPPAGDRPPA